MPARRSIVMPSTIRHYYVDEGGDSTLFSRNGRVLIGDEGCSRFFILSMLDIQDPTALQRNVDALRTQLATDPYFARAPSMQVDARKTDVTFHAKDDLPEVRKEVFALLRRTEGLRYFAVVTDKWRVLSYVRQQNQRNPGYRYSPNELYDYLTRRLFKNLLHKDAGYEIVFSKRGKSDRTTALREALEAARKRFIAQWNIASVAPIHVTADIPARQAGLQAIWCKILTTLAKPATASTTHKKGRSQQRRCHGGKKKSQGYRIVQTVVLQSHGMKPNFVRWHLQYSRSIRNVNQVLRSHRPVQATFWPIENSLSTNTKGLDQTFPSAATARDNAVIRTGPGDSFPVTGLIRAGKSVDIVGISQDGAWLQLANNAWIAANMVEGAPLSQRRVTTLSTPRPTPTWTPPPRVQSTRNCHPSYPTVCIAPPPPDLDCHEIPYRRFRVVGSDPHWFDGDGDGIGCEWD